MRVVQLAGSSGPEATRVPQLGLGTWRLGESRRSRDREVEAVRLALAIGYRLIDTAEMYGDGGAEEVVGQALRDAIAAGELRRDEVTIVTKVLPSHASRNGTIEACQRSLRRLGVESVDIYLLHWRSGTPLAETVGAFETLRERGLIRRWGVSNFDVDDLAELAAIPSTTRCATNQVYYSASQRGIEFDLLPAQRQLGMPVMAYCPIDQGALAGDRSFAATGRRLGLTAAQVALAWVMRHPDVIAIPKATSESHLRDNWQAAGIELDNEALHEIDRHFAAPKRKRRLAMT